MAKGKKSFEELKKELSLDPGNYRLNVEMGFYFLDSDRKVTYQYLKRALRFCDSETDTGAIEQLFTDMEYVYPELMNGMDGLLGFLDEDEDAPFIAVAAGVETHGIAHMLEARYPFAKFIWNSDLANVYRQYDGEVDYLFMDADEVLGSYPQIILAQIRKILKPGGKVLMRASNAAYYRRMFDWLEGVNPEKVGDEPLYHCYLQEELKGLLHRCGYDAAFIVDQPAVPTEDADLLKELLYKAEGHLKCADSSEFMNQYLLVQAVRREEEIE